MIARALIASCLAAAAAAAFAQTAPVPAAPAPPPVVKAYDDPSLSWSPCPPLFPKGCEVAVLRGDPARGPSDVYLRVPAGYDFPTHRHTSPEHMILAAGDMALTYKGSERSMLKAGSYAYGPANLAHKARCTGGGACVLFISFESPIDAEAAPDF